MKKQLKGFLMGLLVSTLLMNTAIGETVKKSIEVVYNSVNLTVNGKKVNADNILYKGTTYVPLRDIAEMLDKEVGWDQKTYTASINDKKVEEIKKEEPTVKSTDDLINKVKIGDTITNDGLSVTIEKIEYNGDNFRPDDPDSTTIYSKGFGVYYKIENKSERVYQKPGIRFKLEPSKFEHEVNSIGYSHHPVKASSYIYPGETLTGFYQYVFERDINISEIKVLMQGPDYYPQQAFGTWLVK
mgnify:CR=1 FL=1